MSPPTQTPKPSSSPQSQSLSVIALISGGKDSLYSILHCIRNGHKVVALANLHPPPLATSSSNDPMQTETGQDDIDSFMYQTIGWNVIPLYEAALGIPLYRAPIVGGAVDAGRVYGDSTSTSTSASNPGSSATGTKEEEDETESLIPLLKKVKAAHPEANAVCAGAILSTYQRTRIEDVAGRLGLTPLAWLWMYPFLPAPVEREVSGEGDEAGLLADMAAVGCSARIVKVASGALDEGFLWGDVADGSGALRRRIVKGVRRFAVDLDEDIRGAVLGEGGEYETLAVNGPEFLWKGRIEVGEEGREVRAGEGGVGYLRLERARVVDKDGGDGDGVRPGDVRRPTILDEEFACALAGLWEGDGHESDDGVVSRATEKGSWTFTEPVQSVSGGIWTVSNITAPEAGPGAAEQMEAIVKKIRAVLDTEAQDKVSPRTTADIVFTTVLLRSMADFPSMNGIYVSLFKKPNPPARATVACGDSLPEGVNVMVSMVVDLGPRAQRSGLHVQSRSYWAPANIGPYSQAMSVPLQGTERVIYIAGQIPLEPASMELVESSSAEPYWAETYSLRAILSLQHMWRIGTTMEVGWWLGAVAFFTGTDHIKARAQLAWKLWQRLHDPKDRESDEEESTLDVWDIKYGRRGHEQSRPIARPQIPNFDIVEAESSKNRVPAFFAVQVHELPRNSDIEWQGLGYRCEGVRLTRTETEFGRTVEATTTKNQRNLCIEIDSEADLQTQIQRVSEVYAAQAQSGAFHCVIYSSQPLPQDCSQGQVIPCKSVWGADGRQLAAGVIIQKQT